MNSKEIKSWLKSEFGLKGLSVTQSSRNFIGARIWSSPETDTRKDMQHGVQKNVGPDIFDSLDAAVREALRVQHENRWLWAGSGTSAAFAEVVR